MSEGDSRRSSRWWRDVERQVDAVEAAYADEGAREPGSGGVEHDDDLPDPWGDVAVGAATLTPDQEALLAGTGDQPPVLRFAGEDLRLGEDESSVGADRGQGEGGEGGEGGAVTDDQPPRPRLRP
jgi:hypothetical protein